MGAGSLLWKVFGLWNTCDTLKQNVKMQKSHSCNLEAHLASLAWNSSSGSLCSQLQPPYVWTNSIWQVKSEHLLGKQVLCLPSLGASYSSFHSQLCLSLQSSLLCGILFPEPGVHSGSVWDDSSQKQKPSIFKSPTAMCSGDVSLRSHFKSGRPSPGNEKDVQQGGN